MHFIMAPFNFLIAASILARCAFALPTEHFDVNITGDNNAIPLDVTNYRMMKRQEEDKNLV